MSRFLCLFLFVLITVSREATAMCYHALFVFFLRALFLLRALLLFLS